MILDEAYANKKHCNIVVTQPRRIAARSIASRISEEREWELGTVVGYQVSSSIVRIKIRNNGGDSRGEFLVVIGLTIKCEKIKRISV